MRHFSGDGVGATEHLAGGIKIAGGDAFADACTGDDLTFEAHSGKAVDEEAQFRAELLEEVNIAGTFMPEGERTADADAIDLAEVADEIADEFLAGNLAELGAERDQERGVDAERFDFAEFLRERVD